MVLRYEVACPGPGDAVRLQLAGELGAASAGTKGRIRVPIEPGGAAHG